MRDKRWERLDGILSRNYSASYMSNTKWIKLLKATCAFYPYIQKINYKLVYSNEVKNTFTEEHEEHISEYWFIEPSIYKEIEWLEFPYEGNSGLTSFETKINQLGKFQVVKTLTGLRILGYERV